jgi:hypothetical protein
MIQRVLPALLVCAALLVPASAGATIAVKLDIDALSTTADTIVLGRVASKKARWEGQRIVTDYAVRVAMPVLGAADVGSTVTVQTLGGRVDDLAQVVHGTPGFVVGEDVLLFLQTVKPSSPLRVVGMAQGRFKVERDGAGDLWATQDLTGLGLAKVVAVDGNGKQSAKMLDHQEPMRLPLRSLLSKVSGSLSRVDVTVRPEVTLRLGEKLDRPYDFAIELGGVRQ